MLYLTKIDRVQLRLLQSIGVVGASPPYTQAVANIRLVGVITAHVLFMLYEQFKMKNLENVHMIGHSLGAHLSGYTGSVLQKEFNLALGRITALDPAEPLFKDTEPVVRLDANDARYALTNA